MNAPTPRLSSAPPAAPRTALRNAFPAAFYVANTMEIFERLAWYGFFTLSSLYMTSPKSLGGLGLSDSERGFLQGMIPFLLYLLPVLTGALADRYGYRRMFLLAFALMSPSYYLLGQMHGFWSFCAAFLGVAIGAACFKPVVVGTIGRATDDSNRGLGFGVFYTMVNIGGFLGPLVAGSVRALGWDKVFIMSSFWIALNFIPALFFYREPGAPAQADRRSLGEVLGQAQEVLGNGRLALLVLVGIVGLMMAAKGGISYTGFVLLLALWLGANALWSRLLCTPQATRWYRQPLRIGHRRFVAYLLILTGFWTVYNQLFLSMPLYLRDFVDTGELVRLLARHAPETLDFFAHISIDAVREALPTLAQQVDGGSTAALEAARRTLIEHQLRIPHEVLAQGLGALSAGQVDAASLAHDWAMRYRQINPEYLVDLDFGAIVLAQIAISSALQRRAALPVLVAGTTLLGLSFVLAACSAHGGALLAVAAILLFALGEMVASPKSQEYVAALAPRQKTAMFMGYYFVAMALGNLFGGLFSGWSYTTLARARNAPEWMWGACALIAFISALALLLFDRQMRRSRM